LPWTIRRHVPHAGDLAGAGGGRRDLRHRRDLDAATSLAAYGMPGCDSFLVPASSELGIVTGGAAHWSIAVPNAPGLAGVQLFQQALVLEPVNPGGAIVTNAGTMTVGIR
jgi:hypothetical protein